MATRLYQVIRRPIITEKGLGVKETQHTVVFEVAADATKTEVKEAVQRIFKVKVERVRTAIYHGKFRRRGRAGRLSQRLEEGLRKARSGREDDRVRGESVIVSVILAVSEGAGGLSKARGKNGTENI